MEEKEKAMAIFSERYDAWKASQQGQCSGYEYERSFDEFIRQMGQALLQQSVGEQANERKKKSLQSRYGMIEVPKSHILYHGSSVFKMTAYWQDQCLYMGQQQVFAEAAESILRLSGTQITAKQIERLCHHYGELAQSQQQQQADQVVTKDTRLHYVMADGGMVLTREQAWKELKLARIFAQADHLPQNQGRNFIKQSQYVAHLGAHDAFFDKLLPLTDRLPSQVWIADGARWIWDMVDTHYPQARQVLDYYHCKEKLCLFAQEAFTDPLYRAEWIQAQEDLLFDDLVETVMANIGLVSCKGKAGQVQQNLLVYYGNNLERMRYKSYRLEGLLIGSGPMEAAHRHVIQHRMKLSGQRWTMKGAQQMATLRALNKSGKWDVVKNLICCPN